MTILSIQFGQVGNVPIPNGNNSLPAAAQTPSIVYIATNDTTATVTAAGYLNALQQSTTDNFVFNNQQMALVYTTDNGCQWYQISINAGTGVITLVADVNPGSVLLPVIVNHIAAFSNVAGQIADPNATIISKSLIQSGVNNSTAGGFIAIPAGNNQGSLRLIPVANAGGFNSIISNTAVGQATTYSLPDPGGAAAQFILNNSAGTQTIATGNLTLTAGNFQVTAGTIVGGTSITAGINNASAGSFVAIPAGNNQGSFRFVPVANAGGFASTLSNTAIGQASTYSLPDPANAAARILVGATATPFVAGNFPINNGTGGLMQDSGIPVASLQLHTNILAHQSANIGGAGAGPLNIVSASVTAASVIVASVVSSSNPVSIIAVAPGAGSFNVTVSADPGANLVISYVIFVAAQ